MGTTSEQAVAVSNDVEQSVHDVVLQMLEDDAAVGAEVREQVLNALAAVEGDLPAENESIASTTFLSSISVAGFRGIGRQARLDLYPAPGLMVVSGRNGSGKSSFAEALELTLTGTSYRWHEKKSALWAESWRNLHQSDPCAIRVDLSAEKTGPLTVGVDWAVGVELAERTTWTQVGSGKRDPGTGDLGWARPLELWRPILSYEELGRLFDGGPSALYDALAKLLGLEVLAEAEKWLTTQLKTMKVARDRADEERKGLQKVLADSTDDRTQRAASLLRKRGGAPLEECLALATGTDGQCQQTVNALRKLSELEAPSLEEIEEAVTRLRAAREGFDAVAHTVADTARQRADLLAAALEFHEHNGDMECPLCGHGRLTSDWAVTTRAAIANTEGAMHAYRAAKTALAESHSVALDLIHGEEVDEVPDVELPALAVYNAAIVAAREIPDAEGDLANHAERTVLALVDAAESVRVQANEALRSREDAWAPLAVKLGTWVGMEREARTHDETLTNMAAAKKWIVERGQSFRNQRLESIAAQARSIWGQLRQESNVDLGEITLEGTATRRKAVLTGSVDGQPTKALSVMSQGELHALALALFLPRATSPKSPFRFVVLDDPIQAMDPAKIDGFVQVLSEIAKTHQVIVFSHDDRLASVIRETGADARLVEVVRESGSKVTVRDNVNPARRQVSDVFALIKDDRLPDDIRARVLPGLFRIAVESAAKQAFYTRQSLAGHPRAEAEKAWASAKKTASRLALAVLGDPGADLKGWLDSKPERRSTLRLCNAVHSEAAGITTKEARELERTVETVLALK